MILDVVVPIGLVLGYTPISRLSQPLHSLKIIDLQHHDIIFIIDCLIVQLIDIRQVIYK